MPPNRMSALAASSGHSIATVVATGRAGDARAESVSHDLAGLLVAGALTAAVLAATIPPARTGRYGSDQPRSGEKPRSKRSSDHREFSSRS